MLSNSSLTGGTLRSQDEYSLLEGSNIESVGCSRDGQRQESFSLKRLKTRIISLKEFVADKKEKTIRNRALAHATKLHQRGLKPANRNDKCLAFDYFVSAMKIRERYAPDSPVLASSFTYVGLSILERELFNSETYSKVAVKCLCCALTILKECYRKQKDTGIITGGIEISVVDLAEASCHAARAHLQLDEIDPALERARYSTRILGIGGSQNISLKKRSPKVRKVMALCCTTIAKILAIRMQEQSDDKAKAIKWFKLAIAIQKQNINSLDLALSLSNLAFFLHDVGDYTGALKNYEQALRIRSRKHKRRRKVKKRDYDNVANMCHILNNTALVLRSMGQLDKARICLKRALDSLPLGSSQIEVAYIVGNLSRLTLEYID